jgi:hypothetical protein
VPGRLFPPLFLLSLFLHVLQCTEFHAFFYLGIRTERASKTASINIRPVELSDKGCRNIAAHGVKMLGAMKLPSVRPAVDFLLVHHVEANEVEAFIDKDWDGWTARGR